MMYLIFEMILGFTVNSNTSLCIQKRKRSARNTINQPDCLSEGGLWQNMYMYMYANCKYYKCSWIIVPVVHLGGNYRWSLK